MGLDNTKQVGALWKRPNRGYNVFLNNRKYLALPPLKNEGTVEFIIWRRKSNADSSASFLENYSRVGSIVKSTENILLMKINEDKFEIIENKEKTSNYGPDLVVLSLEYDKEGYDKYGYDIDGFDREGYDRLGYDGADLINKDTNREGYDKEGYNNWGYNREGYDKGGYDRFGYNIVGISKDTGTIYNREGYDKKGYNREGYDKEGYDRRGFNVNGIHRYTGTPYSIDGFDREGYDRLGYDRGGFDEKDTTKTDMTEKDTIRKAMIVEDLM